MASLLNARKIYSYVFITCFILEASETWFPIASEASVSRRSMPNWGRDSDPISGRLSIVQIMEGPGLAGGDRSDPIFEWRGMIRYKIYLEGRESWGSTRRRAREVKRPHSRPSPNLPSRSLSGTSFKTANTGNFISIIWITTADASSWSHFELKVRRTCYSLGRILRTFFGTSDCNWKPLSSLKQVCGIAFQISSSGQQCL